MHRIKIGQPTLINIADKLQVPSQVEVDEHRLVRVGANVTGRIIDVYAMLGDNVEAGVELARISSPELTQAQLAYLRASPETLAEKAAERARHLLAADVISCCGNATAGVRTAGFAGRVGRSDGSIALAGMDSRVLKSWKRRNLSCPQWRSRASKRGYRY